MSSSSVATEISAIDSFIDGALDHQLSQYFPELLKFESTPEMEASDLYTKIKPEVERLLNAVVVAQRSKPNSRTDSVKTLAWNIERGVQFEGILDALTNHPKLRDKDVLLLTELDYGMARSGNRFVAKELADSLLMNFAFAPVYIALQKGSGVEEFVEGENTNSIHGLAIFSRYP